MSRIQEYESKGLMQVDIYMDVLNRDTGEIFNLVEFLRFKHFVAEGTKWAIKIITISFEGEITLKYCTYDGDTITVIEDRSRHRYGSAPFTSTYKGTEITREEEPKGISYYLITDDNNQRYKFFSFKKCLEYKTM